MTSFVMRRTISLRRNAAKSGWNSSPSGVRRRPATIVPGDGEGHREAHPPALPDLVSHGRAAPGHGPRDPARRRGLQRHERGRLRAPLLRRTRRARLARHRAHDRQAARRRGRAGELLAATGELPPAADRVHRRGARVAAVRAHAPRRRVRLRRAAAPRPAADLLGTAEPAARPGPGDARPRHHRIGRRPRALPAPGEDRDRDLPQQDGDLRLLHDGARRRRPAQGRPLPPALPGRPVLPPRPLARARGAAGVPPVAHPRQGRLRDEGRARLQGPPRRPRPGPASRAPPAGFDPRAYANRADWQFGDATETAEIWISERIAWQIERHFGRFGTVRGAAEDGGDIIFETPYADRRQLAAWVLRLGEHARVLGPPELER